MGWLDDRTLTNEALAHLDGIPDAWFRAKDRTKDEAIALLFPWAHDVTYARVEDQWPLHAYVLTSPERCAVIVFQDNDTHWYPTTRTAGRTVRTRQRRTMLRWVAESVRGATDLPALIDRHGYLDADAGNRQAAAFVPALFRAWMRHNGIGGPQARMMETMVALGGAGLAADLIAEHTADAAAV